MQVMAVDLTGTFNVTRMVIPYLKKSPASVTINMSSIEDMRTPKLAARAF
jgi:NAD(P)-dependent dehydrogenase (short-subunit alcohol dehydrogenase family)